jgi:hypothetical protein
VLVDQERLVKDFLEAVRPQAAVTHQFNLAVGVAPPPRVKLEVQLLLQMAVLELTPALLALM